MKDPVIRVENLGKRYRLGQLEPYRTLRDTVTRAVKASFRALSSSVKNSRSSSGNPHPNGHIWALRNVSFEVREGEVVGIIGRNGAGKTTLLKILSRITDPTEGHAEIWGRVGSLLEVGTGFHPELTGRDNIYLSGAVLGMKRAEIERKFDDIVAFAELERFMNTPVKRYSSGMYVRLAFAVAAHLEPEILLVDEVLAVGDAAFQQKCLGKIGEVAKEGRTVLFVSHNMSAISQLCQRCIWLDEGRAKADLPAVQAVQDYLRSVSSSSPETVLKTDSSKPAQYRSISICRLSGEVASEISCDEAFIVELTFEIRRSVPGMYLAFYFQNAEGVRVLFSDVTDSAPNIGGRLVEGTHIFRITVPPRLLAPGIYSLTVGSATVYGEEIDYCANACSFSIRDYATRRGDSRPGVIGMRLTWNHSYVEASSASRPDIDGGSDQ